MEIFLDILFLIGGLALILIGANGLTDGSAAVAKKWGVSDLVIGLTIVAFGTSAPELVVSLMSAINGSAEIAIGNVVGSNIFNVLMIVGVTALVLPIKVAKTNMTNEIPLVILSALAVVFFANDVLLDGSTENVLSHIDGIIMLLFFAIFMRYTFSIAKNGEQTEDTAQVKSMPGWKSALYILGGLAALIYGGQIFVEGACNIARILGASESLIGLTIVAAGTSLPELATSVTAALKKNSGIAIGNVIGSNIFNIFFILGTSATITPLKLGGITNLDMAVLIGSALLFWFVGWFFKTRTITRIEGALMVACYIAYTIVLIMSA